MNIFKEIFKNNFFKYAFIGGIATLIDWSLFYIFAVKFNFFYQLSLFISFSFASIFNFSVNRIFNFKSKSERILFQFLIYIFISLVSLILNGIVMFIFIEIIYLNKMFSRIATSLMMLSVNYFLNKNITFNKRFF